MATVLIVEDEALIRFALADELICEGHNVIECCNVLEAIAALGAHDDIDAAITDVDMPGGLSGVDLARMLVLTKPSIPVWMTSGRDVDVSEFGDSVAFISKPYNPHIFVERLSLVGSIDAEIRSYTVGGSGPDRSRA